MGHTHVELHDLLEELLPELRVTIAGAGEQVV
jgi:hypothetical protein